uniref:Uncharacterized protein n=1 Tax=Plectus sambesii TaxID=2011161 RepID=A0A914XTK9_9BILA
MAMLFAAGGREIIRNDRDETIGNWWASHPLLCVPVKDRRTRHLERSTSSLVRCASGRPCLRISAAGPMGRPTANDRRHTKRCLPAILSDLHRRLRRYH